MIPVLIWFREKRNLRGLGRQREEAKCNERLEVGMESERGGGGGVKGPQRSNLPLPKVPD